MSSRYELSADGSYQRVRDGPVRVTLVLTVLHVTSPNLPQVLQQPNPTHTHCPCPPQAKLSCVELRCHPPDCSPVPTSRALRIPRVPCLLPPTSCLLPPASCHLWHGTHLRSTAHASSPTSYLLPPTSYFLPPVACYTQVPSQFTSPHSTPPPTSFLPPCTLLR